MLLSGLSVMLLESKRMPKGSPEEQAARDAALEAGYQQAARVPLATARLCLEAIDLAGLVAAKGNRNSASDAGVAALMGRAGVEGAVLNVLINLGSVKDDAFKAACRTETDDLAREAHGRADAVLARVRSTFA